MLIRVITFLGTLYNTTDLVTPLSGLHDIHNSSWALSHIPLGMSAYLHFVTTLKSSPIPSLTIIEIGHFVELLEIISPPFFNNSDR